MDFPELLVFQALLVCQELKEMPVYPVSVDLVHKVLREKQACQGRNFYFYIFVICPGYASHSNLI